VDSNRTYIQQSPVIVALATAHPIHIFSYLFLPNSTQEVEYCMIDDLKFVGGNILAHATRYTFFRIYYSTQEVEYCTIDGFKVCRW